MREHRQIVDRWHEGVGSILVTLIRVQGSSYRQPGAHLMVCRDGTYEGSISAGCLEADLLRKAAWLMRNGPAIERYSTLFDEAAEMPFGLGCGGVLDVLLESVESAESGALLQAIDFSLSGREHLVATWLPTPDQTLRRAVFGADGKVIFASNGIPDEVLAQVHTRALLGADIEGVFVEHLTPPQRLFVFGAGDDAKPLVTMACLLGWSVTVVDGRAHLARESRFPESRVIVASTSEIASLSISSRDAVVIMTHSYEQDREFLASLLPLRPVYLGLLGSRQRSALLIADAAERLDLSLSECCELLSAPVGLDLGGEGAESIALAILAEAHASCMGKRNESQKLSAERVQQYLADGELRSYTQPQCGLSAV